MAEYRLSPAARGDLEAIFDYTAAEWGLAQALRYTDLIEQACAEMAQAPGLAVPCDDIRSGYRRRFAQRHAIYFRVETYGIAVIRILHDRMDAPRHL